MNSKYLSYTFFSFITLLTFLLITSKVQAILPATYPSDILNLQSWKLTLPINNAQEIKQPELQTYSSTYFHLNAAKNAVVFYSPAGGATTPNSSYARSELREMKGLPYSVTQDCAAPDNKACWGSGIGYHSMTIEQAITHLPTIKPHVVVGQIHDTVDDVVVFRLEGKKLFINLDGTADDIVLTTNYELGTRFTVKFEVQNNQTKYYYNGLPVKNSLGQQAVLNRAYKNAYFKAGMYVQSTEGNGAFGESEIYNLSICHASSQASATTECASASTTTPTLTPTQICLGDVNKNGVVDLADYSLLVKEFLQSGVLLSADLNKDSIVDLIDYSILVKHFLKPCVF